MLFDLPLPERDARCMAFDPLSKPYCPFSGIIAISIVYWAKNVQPPVDPYPQSSTNKPFIILTKQY